MATGTMPQAQAFTFEPGSAHPLGTTTYADGVNFSLFSEAATEVALLLFDRASAIEPAQVIRLDPFQHKTFHFWHVFVRGCKPGTYYAFRVDGPADPFYPGVEMDRHPALLETRPHPIGQPSIALHRPVQILADLLRCAGHRPDELGARQLGIGGEESFDVGKRQPPQPRTKIHFAAQEALDALLGFAGAAEQLSGLAEKRIGRPKPAPLEHVAPTVGVSDIESRLLQQSPKSGMAAVDEVSAELDRRLAVASVSGPDPSAHAVPPLDDRDLDARGLEPSRRGEPGRPSPENQNVNRCGAHLGYGAFYELRRRLTMYRRQDRCVVSPSLERHVSTPLRCGGKSRGGTIDPLLCILQLFSEGENLRFSLVRVHPGFVRRELSALYSIGQLLSLLFRLPQRCGLGVCRALSGFELGAGGLAFPLLSLSRRLSRGLSGAWRSRGRGDRKRAAGTGKALGLDFFRQPSGAKQLAKVSASGGDRMQRGFDSPEQRGAVLPIGIGQNISRGSNQVPQSLSLSVRRGPQLVRRIGSPTQTAL